MIQLAWQWECDISLAYCTLKKVDVDLSTIIWSLLFSHSLSSPPLPPPSLSLSLPPPPSSSSPLSCCHFSLTHTLSYTHLGISNLEQLEYLDVSSNQLSRLRAGLKDLTTLQTFIVTDNPLESPPMQVRA